MKKQGSGREEWGICYGGKEGKPVTEPVCMLAYSAPRTPLRRAVDLGWRLGCYGVQVVSMKPRPCWDQFSDEEKWKVSCSWAALLVIMMEANRPVLYEFSLLTPCCPEELSIWSHCTKAINLTQTSQSRKILCLYQHLQMYPAAFRSYDSL